MIESKKELVAYFEANPSLQSSKYQVDHATIRYVNRKVSDGLTQKLVISGLSRYFHEKGVSDVNREISLAMDMIKNQRHSKMVSNIEIRTSNESS